MSDDQNSLQTQDSTENPSPTSPRDSTEPASENTRVSEPSEATQEPQTAQGNDFEPKVESEPLPENGQNEPKPESITPPEDGKAELENKPEKAPEPQTAQIPVNEPLVKTSIARELLIQARNAIQFRKRKKLERIMSLFLKQSKITNDEVEKFLHVSDATATRYLSTLEQEGKIKQNSKTGKGVSYSRI